MKTFSFFILIALTAWTFQSCSESSGKSENNFPKGEIIPVKILKLNKENIQSSIQASGQFTTDDETNLSFKTGGIIEKIYVKEGDAIKKGQLLAILDLTEINAQVAQAKLGYEKSLRDYERATNLYKDSVATLEQFQNAKTGLEVATQQYEAAKFNRNYSEIRAISNGYVLKKLANEGQVISPGSTVLQTNGAGSSKWILKTGVSDKAWAKINLNDKAVISVDAFNDETLDGYVSKKSEGTDPFTGSFTIEITLTGKITNSIASGMFGKATIQPANKVQGWSIPYDALLDGDGQSGFVFVTDDMKTAKKAFVKISSLNTENVIVSEGLENAQGLIISGSAYLRDQSPIQVLEN